MVIKIEVGIEDVKEVYNGPGGKLWELLMGEEIHVGGAKETDVLAEKAGIKKNMQVLDVCSALGGPARHLAQKYACRVTGLDITETMYHEAIRRTNEVGLDNLVDFRLGNALEMPFEKATFDVVWGQDAWCYVTDKERLISECCRVLKPNGTIAFTDWLQASKAGKEDLVDLLTFMVFPYLQDLGGYEVLLNKNGFEVLEKEDLGEDFADHIAKYLEMLKDLESAISQTYGNEMFDAAEQGISQWARAARENKVTRGRIVARKAAPR